MLGLLGALDPYKHKLNLGQIDKTGDTGAVLSMSDSKTAVDNTQTGKSIIVYQTMRKVWVT